MIYLKFWKQACVPTLLFGAEIWSFTSAHLEKLERCQMWFIKRLFHLPDYTSNEILAIVSGIPPVATLINQKKLYFLGRIVTLPKIPDVVKAVMKSRLLDFFQGGNSSPHGFLHDIACLLEKDKLMTCALLENSSLFPSCCKWKAIVNSRLFRIHDSRPEAVGLEVPNLKLVLSAFTSMNPNFYWFLTSEMPDLVPKRHTQLRVMGNSGMQGGIPWLGNSCKSIYPISQSEEEDNYNFLLL